MAILKLFACNSNPTLALHIAKQLHLPLGHALVGQFKDGETRIEIKEDVRDSTVFIIQSLCQPVNHHLMELLLMADAIKRASAKNIIALIPYYGYARQDKRLNNATVPVSAKLVADILVTSGITQVITIDLHADPIQEFFSVPIHNLPIAALFLEDLKTKLQNDKDWIIVSPDIGGVERARRFAKYLQADLAIVDKRRLSPNEAKIMNIMGEVNNRNCILMDDMIDTGGTFCLAAKALKEKGAKRIIAYATHALLSDDAVEKVESSTIDELIVTDTIALNTKAKDCKKIRQVSVAKLLADTIKI